MITKTLGFLAFVGLVTVPTAQAFAMTQQDLYQSYALAYVGDIALGATVNVQSAHSYDDTDMGSEKDVHMDADVQTGTEMELQRSDMLVDASVSSAAMVATEEDLQSYTSATMESDPQFERAVYSDSAVTVWYTQPSKMLGFIPVDMSVKATSDGMGNVTVSYPWYSFMASSMNKTELEASLSKQMSAHMSAEGSSTLTTRDQAELMTELRVALAAALN